MAAPAREPTLLEDPALAATMGAETAEPSARRRAPPPALAERYEDLQLVGEGGMGIVYRGFDPRLGRAVALKLIKGDDPALWRRFIQEARAQARVSHDNVCRVYEAGQADGEPFVVMQFIDGEPLSRLARTLSLEQGVALMRDVARAVHEAHRLGLIHRDLKPQNILVETQEDGSRKPYVVDFGLAREAAERGQTATGAVVGTPAYMPPEQALGDMRAMDRRSDVYALGATLYDLVAGRPPFADEHPWKLLMKVAYEDAPPLGRVKKGVPPDVETIVMKCLERSPARRYDSARALAEDLGRFLDGEPVRARRASLAYVAWKKARKHRLATALAAAALAGAISVGGVWARGRRDAVEQARLGQAMGEDVKGMELFLRDAYGMPLHDVERERDIVRARLARIEANMARAGRVGLGPGHYAMGRGHLALGDPAAARAHLEAARAAGYAPAALEVALGQALGELFRRAVEETKRITNAEERKKKVAALEAELRDPALVHLRAGAGAELDAPAYVEGLIALYEGKHEEALAKARAAFEAAPWLHEAKKLEGDAEYAMGSPFRHDAAFDYDRMMAHFGPAADAYRAAADLARSDPEVHRAECELWEKIGWAEYARNAPAGRAFDTADAACARAVTASHADPRARVQRALVLSARMEALSAAPPDALIPLADAAVRAAEEARAASPDDVMARYAVARALYVQATLLVKLERGISMAPVIAAYQEVVALDPRFTWAISELGDAYYAEAGVERDRGGDARTPLQGAQRAFERAAALDPAFLLAAQKRVKVSARLLELEIDAGRGSDVEVDAFFAAVSSLGEAMGPGTWYTAFWGARAYRLRALRELDLGRDPRGSTQAASDVLRPFLGPGRKDPTLFAEVAEQRLLEARYALRSGLPLRPILDDARRAARDAAEALGAPSDDLRCLSARVELLSARDAERQGDARPETFEAALAPLRAVLSTPRADPRPHALLAEIHALRASWRVKHGKDPREDLAAGQAEAGEALSRNPRLATALAARGLLELVAARAARGKTDREGAARQAKEAFAAAFRESPPLARDHADEQKELDGLLPEGG